MQKLQFTAIEIENDVNEYDILIVGFYNPDEEHYLMIQHQDEYDEDDADLGMNTYHIERDDQSYGNYGGVEKVILQSNQIQFILNPHGKKSLQCEEVLIDFEINDRQFLELKVSLIKIFAEAFELID